ncbi:MAG: hypothetical protein ACD_62C00092G0005 [uncultured bacterium]|nr:MAG: hypothetical protein ACD_62C00092G0005 [uncultured bacterium]HLD44876.1 type II CAAX endopeptidase family protein [bacterium]
MKPWNAPITLLFWLALFITSQLPLLTLIVVLLLTQPDMLKAGSAALSSNALLLVLASLIHLASTVVFSVMFIRLKRGLSVRAYLALNKASLKTYLLWILFTLLFASAAGLAEFLFNGHDSQIWFEKLWSSTTNHIPLLLSIFVLAPLSEEILYRGVLQTGLAQSRLGFAGAVIIPSLLWAGTHLQYNAFDMGLIFLLGLLLGIARQRTQSLYVTIAMHCAMNLFSVCLFLITR